MIERLYQRAYVCMAGRDEKDATTVQIKSEPVRQALRAGTFDAFWQYEHIDVGMKAICDDFLTDLTTRFNLNRSFDFPYLEYLVPAYYILTTAEASSNLSRFNGMRYGLQTQANTIEEQITINRTAGFGEEVKRRIMLGSFVLSAGYYDSFYTKASQIRIKIRELMNRVFEDIDVLILPTSPVFPWKLYQEMSPAQMYIADIFTVLPSLAGLPALSIPVANGPNGFDVSIQAIGPKFSEINLLSFADSMSQDV